jgi:hypothetical protein
VDELRRVLKPGGLLLIKELSIDTFETPFGRAARRFVEHPYEFMFGKDELLAYAEGRGLKALICEPHSMPGFLTDFLLVARKER